MTYQVSTNSIAQPFLQVDGAGAEVVPPTATGQVAANASLASIDGKTPVDAAQVLAWDGTSHSTTGYSSAYIEVTTYNTAITVKGGIAANNPMQVLNLLDNSTAATITATGLYVVPAVGNLTLAGLGSGVVNLLLKR